MNYIINSKILNHYFYVKYDSIYGIYVSKFHVLGQTFPYHNSGQASLSNQHQPNNFEHEAFQIHPQYPEGMIIFCSDISILFMITIFIDIISSYALKAIYS